MCDKTTSVKTTKDLTNLVRDSFLSISAGLCQRTIHHMVVMLNQIFWIARISNGTNYENGVCDVVIVKSLFFVNIFVACLELFSDKRGKGGNA